MERRATRRSKRARKARSRLRPSSSSSISRRPDVSDEPICVVRMHKSTMAASKQMRVTHYRTEFLQTLPWQGLMECFTISPRRRVSTVTTNSRGYGFIRATANDAHRTACREAGIRLTSRACRAAADRRSTSAALTAMSRSKPCVRGSPSLHTTRSSANDTCPVRIPLRFRLVLD